MEEDKLNEAKEEIIPKDELQKDGFLLTDTEMVVPMTTTGKNLFDRMLKVPRIKQNLDKALAKVPEGQKVIIELTAKVGSDGFTADTMYMQLGEDGQLIDDSKILGTSLVVVKLAVIYEDGSSEVIEKCCTCNSSLGVKPNR